MSDKLPVFSSKKFIRAAKRLGFKIKKGGKGSHTRLVHSKSNIILSVPKTQTVSVGIRHQLIKNLEKIGIPREKFIKLLSIGLLLMIKNFFRN
ncbi:MAG: type II toxin-antitoxin system HicA family toxin [Patescibacteria group bacterium]|nr:type II toxin-antitoxin system HicA family toxin [Patescibacteria group bacterium]